MHTRVSNRDHVAMEGIFLIGEGFQAPGYAPVDGATYKIHSPCLGGSKSDKSDSGLSARGRKLFAEYTSRVGAGPHDLPATGYHPTLQALLQDVRIYSYALNPRIY